MIVLPALLALPFAAAALLLLAPRAGRNAAPALTGGAAALGMLVLAATAPQIAAGDVLRLHVDWLPTLGLAFSLRMDGFGWLFAAIVLGIGIMVVAYARWYLAPGDSPRRFFGLLALFMGAMLGITLAGNLLLLLVFWELTSIASFLLIGFWRERSDARAGARMALTITGGGGLALLAGVLLIGRIVGSFELDVVLASGDAIRAHPLYVPALVLVLIGAFAKSAQFPLHFWLPHAMAAPTPVSAYLHSATMVKAGVFLLARLHPALAGSDAWFWIVTSVGIATLLTGAALAIVQQDLKGLLAYSTISHLGLITLLLGLDTELAVVAAVFHILNHATFKASLFMAAGIIDHETGTRDFRKLNGLWRYMPVTGALAIVASLAMAGVPLLNGFLSKEMFFAETLGVESHAAMEFLVPAAALLAGVFAVAYSLRFVHDVFFNGEPVGLERTPHEPPRFLRVPVELLVAVCVAVGVLPQYTIAPLIEIGARGVLMGELPEYKIALWHGLNLPLLLSTLALAGGIALYFGLQRGINLHRIERRSRGKWVFDATLTRLLALARRVTRTLESGSLQQYLGLLLGMAIVLAAAPLLDAGPRFGSAPAPALDPLLALALAGVAAAAVATVVWRQDRLRALLAVGATGLGVSLVFALLAAPDLALTQLLVETASVVLILLTLRWLPPRGTAERGTGLRKLLHAIIALTVGAGASVLVFAVLTRPSASVSEYFLRESLPAGGGANVVNVIIVDFRGLDTLGEIAVFGIAALIIHGLLRGARAVPEAAPPNRGDDGRSLLLETCARWLLPLAAAVSLYFFLRGHNAPGGGFIAGLVLAIALLLPALAQQRGSSGPAVSRDGHGWLGAGLLVAGAAGIGSALFGHPFLTSSTPHVHVPLIGELHLASATVFDIGVYLCVTGATLLMMQMLQRIRPLEDRA